MPLQRINEFDPDYRQAIQGNDLKDMSVYSEGTNEKIGSVSDVVVDHDGKFRYVVVDLGLWIFGKKVLLPIGRARIDSSANRVYVNLTKQQAENLPEYTDSHPVDYDYEERVRGVYRTAPLETSTALETSAPLEPASTAAMSSSRTYDRNTY
ncbi:MAG TPA: photosystem reaction center subunit H, partial [Cyanobacteria bacterium UBA11049]|nr:photosystem reaction center subunit H [Cyanobacteria bacterium UBA11049]